MLCGLEKVNPLLDKMLFYSLAISVTYAQVWAFPRFISGKEPADPWRRQRCSINPWVGEDALEEERASHSGVLAWRIPWTEEWTTHSPWGCKEFGHD